MGRLSDHLLVAALLEGLGARLSVHLLPLSLPLWMPASLVLCPTHPTAMAEQTLQGDREEPTAEVVVRDGGMRRWGEGMILEKESLLYGRK